MVIFRPRYLLGFWVGIVFMIHAHETMDPICSSTRLKNMVLLHNHWAMVIWMHACKFVSTTMRAWTTKTLSPTSLKYEFCNSSEVRNRFVYKTHAYKCAVSSDCAAPLRLWLSFSFFWIHIQQVLWWSWTFCRRSPFRFTVALHFLVSDARDAPLEQMNRTFVFVTGTVVHFRYES